MFSKWKVLLTHITAFRRKSKFKFIGQVYDTVSNYNNITYTCSATNPKHSCFYLSIPHLFPTWPPRLKKKRKCESLPVLLLLRTQHKLFSCLGEPTSLLPACVSNLVSYHCLPNSLCFRQGGLHSPPFLNLNKACPQLRSLHRMFSLPPVASPDPHVWLPSLYSGLGSEAAFSKGPSLNCQSKLSKS